MGTPASRRFRYRVVDVFTTEPLAGNPLAVFLDGSGLDGELMQRIAREMNLAETTFVLPPADPECAAAVRIFTPRKEMAFAGHPTIGTSFVLLDERRVAPGHGSFALEEKVGPVPIWVDAGESPMIWLRTPPIRERRAYDRSTCAEALGLREDELIDLAPRLLDAGNPTLLIGLRDAGTVDRAWLDSRGMSRLRGSDPEPFCVFVFARTREGAYSRMFAPDYGIAEDAASGSSTGPLAAFMMDCGLLATASGTRFVSEQGTKMGRRSLLHVRIEGERGRDGIYVGGHVRAIAEGVMTL